MYFSGNLEEDVGTNLYRILRNDYTSPPVSRGLKQWRKCFSGLIGEIRVLIIQ